MDPVDFSPVSGLSRFFDIMHNQFCFCLLLVPCMIVLIIASEPSEDGGDVCDCGESGVEVIARCCLHNMGEVAGISSHSKS